MDIRIKPVLSDHFVDKKEKKRVYNRIYRNLNSTARKKWNHDYYLKHRIKNIQKKISRNKKDE